jgi:cytochrome c556
MLKHITAAIAMTLTLAAPIAAQTKEKPHGQAIRPRAALMAKRLRQGVRSGQLTRDDAAEIRQRLQAFRAEARQLRADGSLSKEDRQALRQEWRQIRQFVRGKKHK